MFFLERKNIDASQKNVVFLSRGESADRALAIAGRSHASFILFSVIFRGTSIWICFLCICCQTLWVVSLCSRRPLPRDYTLGVLGMLHLFSIITTILLQADRNSEQIKRLQQESQIEHEFSVFIAPRRTLVANKIFEEAGVLGDISVEEFPLYFLPMDVDVLSLELEHSFADLFLVR